MLAHSPATHHIAGEGTFPPCLSIWKNNTPQETAKSLFFDDEGHHDCFTCQNPLPRTACAGLLPPQGEAVQVIKGVWVAP